jgi:hypothetical protein
MMNGLLRKWVFLRIERLPKDCCCCQWFNNYMHVYIFSKCCSHLHGVDLLLPQLGSYRFTIMLFWYHGIHPHVSWICLNYYAMLIHMWFNMLFERFRFPTLSCFEQPLFSRNDLHINHVHYFPTLCWYKCLMLQVRTS